MSSPFQLLLVHLDPSGAAADRLVIARRLAQDHGARLAALYATSPIFTGMAYAPEIPLTTASMLMDLDNERRDRTRKMLDETLATPGVAVAWGETVAMPIAAALAQQAFHADLLVLGQRDPGGMVQTGVPPDLPEAVVIASGKPALVIPYVGWSRTIGENVAIAWKETREAARAVAAALPILQKAARVHVLSWGEEEAPVVEGARLDLASYLRVHGVEATWHPGGPEPKELGEIVLSRVSDLDADLLVMGCYGHSRAREWILGGASRCVLAAMTLPVLMAN